jgi:Haem-degrading
MNGINAPKRPDCVADDAVSCEPVSAAKFPANREINREFCRIRSSTAILMRDQRADSITYGRIPDATEQGISKGVSGKIFQGTGNFHLRIVGFQPPLQRIEFLEATEVTPTIAITSLLLILACFGERDQRWRYGRRRRLIIDGAVAFTRDQNLNMAVVVVDAAGNLVSADKMDGTTINNSRFAEGKAFASAILRQTTEVLVNLAKERPDRYFGIMNMYPGKPVAECRSPLTADSSALWALRDCPGCRRESSPGWDRCLGEVP